MFDWSLSGIYSYPHIYYTKHENETNNYHIYNIVNQRIKQPISKMGYKRGQRR